MSFWSWLTGDNAETDNRNRGSNRQEAGRKLDAAMPMSAAGAILSAEHDSSETERALKQDAQVNQPVPRHD